MEHTNTTPKSMRYKKRQRQLRKKKRAAKKKNRSQSSSVSYEPQSFGDAAAIWSNSFNNIISWQYQHQIAYWKSKAVALTYENKVLHSIIKDLYKNGSGDASLNTNLYSKKESQQNTNIADYDEEDDCDFVLSEEMLAFLQKSAEHRMNRELEKKKMQENVDAAKTAPPDCSSLTKRKEEMKALYGSNADKIIGLETSLQLNYDNYIDSNNPVFWPNIPLVL